MKTFLNYFEILFSVWSFISTNFPLNENFKNSFPPLFFSPHLILKNFNSPQILLSSKIQSPPFPPLHKGGGEAAMTGVVLVPHHTWKCVPTAISSGADVSEVPGCYLLQQTSSQWGSQKLPQGLVSHELTAYFFVFLPIFNSINYGHVIKRM